MVSISFTATWEKNGRIERNQFQHNFNWNGYFHAKCAWCFFLKTQGLYWYFRLQRKYGYQCPKILFCRVDCGQAYGKPVNRLIHGTHLWLLLWYHCEETCENVSQIMRSTVILVSLKASLALLCAFVCTTWAHASKCHPDYKRAGNEVLLLYQIRSMLLYFIK